MTGGNTETFYGVPSSDIRGATERRNRIRLSFLIKVIKALETGFTVTLVEADQETNEDTTECDVVNPHGPSTCSGECFTNRAQFVRGAIVACFPGRFSEPPPTTYI